MTKLPHLTLVELVLASFILSLHAISPFQVGLEEEKLWQVQDLRIGLACLHKGLQQGNVLRGQRHAAFWKY